VDVLIVSSLPGESEVEASVQPKPKTANRAHRTIDALRGLMRAFV
jgi:hypothetical protein